MGELRKQDRQAESLPIIPYLAVKHHADHSCGAGRSSRPIKHWPVF